MRNAGLRAVVAEDGLEPRAHAGDQHRHLAADEQQGREVHAVGDRQVRGARAERHPQPQARGQHRRRQQGGEQRRVRDLAAVPKTQAPRAPAAMIARRRHVAASGCGSCGVFRLRRPHSDPSRPLPSTSRGGHRAPTTSLPQSRTSCRSCASRARPVNLHELARTTKIDIARYSATGKPSASRVFTRRARECARVRRSGARSRRRYRYSTRSVIPAVWKCQRFSYSDRKATCWVNFTALPCNHSARARNA